MSSSLNRVTLIGHLGADPDIRDLPEGGRVANFSVATSDKWVDKESGEARENVEWSRISIFSEPLIALAEKYLHKGSRVYVEGSLHTRKWVDRKNIERYSTEIVIRPFSGALTLLDAPKHEPSPESAPTPTRAEKRNRRRDPDGPQPA